MDKKAILAALVCAILASCLFVTGVFAQSVPKPSVPIFTVRVVSSYSYSPPITKSSTDPYTNITTVNNYPGSNVTEYAIEIKIQNQPFQTTIDGNASGIYYNLRSKPHFRDTWSQQYNETTRIGTVVPQSSSGYTLFPYPMDFNSGHQIDFQVQAISAYNYTSYEYLEHLPPTYTGPYPVPVTQTIFVGFSNWSDTQTLIIPLLSSESSSPSFMSSPTIAPTPSLIPTSSSILSPSPTQPVTREVFPIWGYAVFAALAFVIGVLVGVVVMMRRRLRSKSVVE